MSDPIAGPTGAQVQGLTPQQAHMDPYELLQVLATERTEALKGASNDQAAAINQKNERIKELNELLENLDAAKAQPPDTAQLKQIGEEMENWGSQGGESWMDPDFKDELDKFGIQTKASGMTKEQMEDGSGWTVAYPTDEYHDLGKQVVEKANEIASGQDPDFPPKLDLNSNIPGSQPPETYAAALKTAGISIPQTADGQVTLDQLNSIKENVKLGIDSVSSNSQLDMIKLQGLINKMSENEQLASGAESKRDQSSSAIIQKIS